MISDLDETLFQQLQLVEIRISKSKTFKPSQQLHAQS